MGTSKYTFVVCFKYVYLTTDITNTSATPQTTQYTLATDTPR